MPMMEMLDLEAHFCQQEMLGYERLFLNFKEIYNLFKGDKMFYDIQLPRTGKGAIFECLCCNWKGEEAIYINNSFITKLGEYLNNSKHVCPHVIGHRLP